MGASESRQVPLPDIGQGLAVQKHLSCGWPIQSRQDIQQGGFAGAGLTHDGYILPRLHGEIHVLQRLHLAAAEAAGVDLLQVLYFQ